MSDDTPDDDQEEQPQAVFPDQGPNREGMVSGYIPDDDDWQAKTHLNINDPAAVSALRNMGEMFPEVDDLQPMIDSFLDDFMKSKTSVKGKSREEYRKIFMAMYGKSDDAEGSKALQLVAPEED